MLLACTSERERPVSSEGSGPGPSSGPSGSGGDGASGASGGSAQGGGGGGGNASTGGAGGALATGGGGGAGGSACPGGKFIVIEPPSGPQTVCTTGEVGEYCLVGTDCESGSCDLLPSKTYGTCE